jgi:hypothetical protein
MVTWSCVMCFLPYKFVLVLVNTASVYWTMLEYARFFARRHFRVTDDPAVIEVDYAHLVLSADSEAKLQVVTEAREPKTGKPMAQRKVSIAIGGSMFTGMARQSLAPGDSFDARQSGGSRKLTAVHRPSISVADSGFPISPDDARARMASAGSIPRGSVISEESRYSSDDLPTFPTRRLSIGTVPLSTLGIATEDPQALAQDGAPPPRRLSLVNAIRRRSVIPGAGLDEEAQADKSGATLTLGSSSAGLFGILRRPSAAVVIEEVVQSSEPALPEVRYNRPVTTIAEEDEEHEMEVIEQADEDDLESTSPKP